jgi:hypothetical protein
MNIILQASETSFLSKILPALIGSLIGGGFAIFGIFLKDFLDKRKERIKEKQRIQDLKEELKLTIRFFIEKIASQQKRLDELLTKFYENTLTFKESINKQIKIESFIFNSITNQDLIKIFNSINPKNNIFFLIFQTKVLQLENLVSQLNKIIENFENEDDKLINLFADFSNDFVNLLNIYRHSYNKNDNEIIEFLKKWDNRNNNYVEKSTGEYFTNFILPSFNELRQLNKDVELYKIYENVGRAKCVMETIIKRNQHQYDVLLGINQDLSIIKQEFEDIFKYLNCN